MMLNIVYLEATVLAVMVYVQKGHLYNNVDSFNVILKKCVFPLTNFKRLLESSNILV